MRKKYLNYLENIYTFNELYNKGVRVGDIVAYAANEFDCGIAWDYVLLRNGFPKEFNTSLCCYKDPRVLKMHLYQIGFHWCGDTSSFRFRIPTEEEKKEFIEECIHRLKEPMQPDWGWATPHYAQVLGALIQAKLIDKDDVTTLNEELKEIHNIDILKYYKEFYEPYFNSRK